MKYDYVNYDCVNYNYVKYDYVNYDYVKYIRLREVHHARHVLSLQVTHPVCDMSYDISPRKYVYVK